MQSKDLTAFRELLTAAALFAASVTPSVVRDSVEWPKELIQCLEETSKQLLPETHAEYTQFFTDVRVAAEEKHKAHLECVEWRKSAEVLLQGDDWKKCSRAERGVLRLLDVILNLDGAPRIWNGPMVLPRRVPILTSCEHFFHPDPTPCKYMSDEEYVLYDACLAYCEHAPHLKSSATSALQTVEKVQVNLYAMLHTRPQIQLKGVRSDVSFASSSKRQPIPPSRAFEIECGKILERVETGFVSLTGCVTLKLHKSHDLHHNICKSVYEAQKRSPFFEKLTEYLQLFYTFEMLASLGTGTASSGVELWDPFGVAYNIDMEDFALLNQEQGDSSSRFALSALKGVYTQFSSHILYKVLTKLQNRSYPDANDDSFEFEFNPKYGLVHSMLIFACFHHQFHKFDEKECNTIRDFLKARGDFLKAEPEQKEIGKVFERIGEVFAKYMDNKDKLAEFFDEKLHGGKAEEPDVVFVSTPYAVCVPVNSESKGKAAVAHVKYFLNRWLSGELDENMYNPRYNVGGTDGDGDQEFQYDFELYNGIKKMERNRPLNKELKRHRFCHMVATTPPKLEVRRTDVACFRFTTAFSQTTTEHVVVMTHFFDKEVDSTLKEVVNNIFEFDTHTEEFSFGTLFKVHVRGKVLLLQFCDFATPPVDSIDDSNKNDYLTTHELAVLTSPNVAAALAKEVRGFPFGEALLPDKDADKHADKDADGDAITPDYFESPVPPSVILKVLEILQQRQGTVSDKLFQALKGPASS